MKKKNAAEAAPPAEGSSTAGGGTAQQFVIFFVDGETFAVSLSEVKEIIRMPDVVRVPLSPPSLEGLANLRGSILPIVSTRRLFAREAVDHDDATRVVILDHGQAVGAVVDRVASVVTIEADKIESAASVEGSIGSGMLRGMIKDQAGYGLIMVLETRRLVEQDFGAFDLSGRGDRLGQGLPANDSGPADTASRGEDRSDELQLVSFEVAGQEYALPIHSVQEIVQLPERFTRVPKAAPSVVGVMNLRSRLLPIVSLRSLFGLDVGELAEHNRVVVVSLDGGAMSVGVVMDRVKEVLRVNRSGIDAMPPLLSSDENLKEITSICRLENGTRLVSILSAEAMFNRDELSQAIDQAGGKASDMNEAAAERHEGAKVEEEQFVVFRLMDEEYGVGIESVQEIVRVPEEIANVPNTPAFIKGVVNLRGSVIPLIDQRSRFGLPSCDPHDRQRIVVFTLQGVQTGFIVDSVSEVMRISQARISPAPDMSAEQRRIIRRVANLTEHKRMILLLDTEQMLDQREVRELKKAA